jgi:3-hydroxy-D-aspartate aldolase
LTRPAERGAVSLPEFDVVFESVKNWGRWGDDDQLGTLNYISQPAKIGLLAALARGRRILVAIDDAGNAQALSDAAAAAGSRIQVLIEVDTGMDRAGVDSPREALDLARRIQGLPGIELAGLTGYEGHCAGTSRDLRSQKQEAAMGLFLEAAELLESNGIPCPVRSAAGTATWKATASLAGPLGTSRQPDCPRRGPLLPGEVPDGA